tara:strand:+ start:515 stop:829 length:315 start_codon:yes stop_codon:yes gene_type:complete
MPKVATKERRKAAHRKNRKEQPTARGRRRRREKLLAKKAARDKHYAENPHSVLPSVSVAEGWNAGSEGHMSEVLKPARGFKHGGAVYSDARGAGAAVKGIRYRS